MLYIKLPTNSAEHEAGGYVGGSSIIQALCHMTQVDLQLKVAFLCLQMCKYITN